MGSLSPTFVVEVSIWDLLAPSTVSWRSTWQRETADVAGLPHGLTLDKHDSWATPTLGVCTGESVDARIAVRAGRAVVVLGVASEPTVPAAAEIWLPESPQFDRLALRRAWYSQAASPMAEPSRHSRIVRGLGLPGLALDLGAPAYLHHLAESEVFVRSFGAGQARLHHGLALPAAGEGAAVVLLAAPELPLARRLLIVAHDGPPRTLVGHCSQSGELFGRSPDPAAAPALRGLLADCSGPTLLVDDADLAVSLVQGAQALLVWPFPQASESPRTLLVWL